MVWAPICCEILFCFCLSIVGGKSISRKEYEIQLSDICDEQPEISQNKIDF